MLTIAIIMTVLLGACLLFTLFVMIGNAFWCDGWDIEDLLLAVVALSIVFCIVGTWTLWGRIPA